MLLNRRHEHVHHGHRNKRQISAMNELRRQDDDQNDTGPDQANAVNDP